MTYHIQLVGNHYVKISENHVEIISIATNGRYDYQCFTNEVILHIFQFSDEKKPISQELYDLQYKAWEEYRKINPNYKPALLGDAVPELIEANCMCGRNNLCDDCKDCQPECTCFECIKSTQVIG